MKHIVLIDDDMFIRDLVGTKLSESYSVAAAENTEKGLALIHEKKPDLLLLDLELPDKHGLQFLKELKVQPSTSDFPVIVFSNNDADEWADKAKAEGAIEYVVKVSMDMNELKEHIDKILS